jgi:hypothetical protein
MELACNTSLKIKFEALPLPDFFVYIINEYVELSQLAIDILLLSGATYPCEKTFSAMTAIKSKYCKCIHLKSGLRVAVSTIHHRMMSPPVSNMQAHPSH